MKIKSECFHLTIIIGFLFENFLICSSLDLDDQDDNNSNDPRIIKPRVRFFDDKINDLIRVLEKRSSPEFLSKYDNKRLKSIYTYRTPPKIFISRVALPKSEFLNLIKPIIDDMRIPKSIFGPKLIAPSISIPPMPPPIFISPPLSLPFSVVPIDTSFSPLAILRGRSSFIKSVMRNYKKKNYENRENYEQNKEYDSDTNLNGGISREIRKALYLKRKTIQGKYKIDVFKKDNKNLKAIILQFSMNEKK